MENIQFAPIEKAFVISPWCDVNLIGSVLKMVERIHRIPVIPVIRIEPNLNGISGEFDPGANTIRLLPGDRFQTVTLLHELGHALDWFALKQETNGYASELNSPLLRDWDVAVRESRAFRMLRKRAEQIPVDGIGLYSNYLVEPRELWARSYAQFIASHATLMGDQPSIELERILIQDRRRGLPEHWVNSDFSNIASAISSLLEHLQWSR